jgi:glycosyltransferase involved in cell wall biosynthesis
MYRERYPNIDVSRYVVIPNGYDEESFVKAEDGFGLSSRDNRIVLLHSGVLYPNERDPTCFYDALARLQRAGKIRASEVQVVFRSTGHDAHHRKLIGDRGLQELVTLPPRLPYRDALREMLSVDGLLIFQASNCNHQVPAKIYEYMRARKPIFALTDPQGDTAGVLRAASLDAIVPLDNEELIAKGLSDFLAALRNGKAKIASDAHIVTHSRLARSAALAKLFDEVSAESGS